MIIRIWIVLTVVWMAFAGISIYNTNNQKFDYAAIDPPIDYYDRLDRAINEVVENSEVNKKKFFDWTTAVEYKEESQNKPKYDFEALDNAVKAKAKKYDFEAALQSLDGEAEKYDFDDFSLIAVPPIALGLLLLIAIRVNKKYNIINNVKNISKSWRMVVTIAFLWIIGAPLFIWVFDIHYYHSEDVIKITFAPALFGIFAYWILSKQQR